MKNKCSKILSIQVFASPCKSSYAGDELTYDKNWFSGAILFYILLGLVCNECEEVKEQLKFFVFPLFRIVFAGLNCTENPKICRLMAFLLYARVHQLSVRKERKK